MKTATIDDIMKWEPCWLEDASEAEVRVRIQKFMGRRKAVTGLDIIRSWKLSVEHKLWCLLRNFWFSDRELRLLACDFAERALPVWETAYPEDDRPRQAIDTARRFVRGEATAEELEVAAVAARSAAVAARSAADSAWSAMWSAARSAADSAWSAMWSAARSARSAARSARSAAD
jgi:hypothetical protein